MAYNMTQLAATTDIYGLVTFANDATGQILLGLFVLAIFFVMLMALKRYEFDAALLVSSFSCFIISLVLVYIHLLALTWALLYLIVAAFTAFYMFVLSG